MSTLSEQEFRIKSDEALEQARQALLPLADQEGFEVEMGNGVLNLLFEDPSEARFVVSPNAPVRQIWVSAMARGYRLAWEPTLAAFALDAEPLPKLLERLVRVHLGSRPSNAESGS
jgi:CyaY protein